MANFSSVTRTGKQIGREFSGKNVTFMAAGIAYNAFVSLAPILLLLLLVVSMAGGGLEDRLIDVAQESLPGPIADVTTTVFEGNAASPAASVVGIVVLIWGALKIFRGLDTAFSEIYETTAKNSFVDTLIDAVVVLLALVIAVLVTVGVTALVAILSEEIPYIGYLSPIALIVGLVIAFLPMYYRFPDADLAWKDVIPGVLFAAVGWAALQALFQVYLRFAGGGSESLFGGVIVVVTWLYFSGLVLLLGAVINAVLGGYATGKEGGVGRGAGGFDTTHEGSMSRDEFADYLEQLREDLTDHYRGMRPSAERQRVDRFGQPVGDVDVIEQSTVDGDERKWEVAIRWRSNAGQSGEPAESADETDKSTDETPKPADKTAEPADKTAEPANE